MKKLIVLALIFCISNAYLSGQSTGLFVAGFSFPQGDFADDDYYDAIFDGAGYAGTGIMLGLKTYTPMRMEGLSAMFNLSILYNPMHKDFKDEFEDDWDEDATFPKYLNLPVMAGLNYQYPVMDQFTLFGEAGLGLNVLWITNFSIKDDDYKSVYSFTPSLKIGYTIGGGVVIQEKYTISLNYLGLGSHKCKFKWEEDWDWDKERGEDKFDKSLDIRALTLTFGWIL